MIDRIQNTWPFPWLASLGWLEYLLLMTSLFVVLAGGSLLMVAVILVRLPADFFRSNRTAGLWRDRSWPVRLLLYTLKNLAGVAMVAVGVVLSLPGVPGQGLLTILIGLLLLDFPGKHALLRRLLAVRGLLSAVNRLRARYGQPPMELDGKPGIVSDSAADVVQSTQPSESTSHRDVPHESP